MIQIQILDSNMWITVLSVSELDTPFHMLQTKNRNNNTMVRAVNEEGHVVYSL